MKTSRSPRGRAQKRIVSEAFSAGFGKAMEMVDILLRVNHRHAIPGYCKGGAVSYLTTGYSIVMAHDGVEAADKWLTETLAMVADDLAAGRDAVKLSIAVMRRGK